MSLIRGIAGALETFQALLHLYWNSVFREIRSCSEICKIPELFFPGASAFNNMQLMQGGVLQPVLFANHNLPTAKFLLFILDLAQSCTGEHWDLWQCPFGLHIHFSQTTPEMLLL